MVAPFAEGGKLVVVELLVVVGVLVKVVAVLLKVSEVGAGVEDPANVALVVILDA